MARSFFGGVHPRGFKELSKDTPIRPLHPKIVSIAMSQHIGAPCQPLVSVGQRVLVGQKIGDGKGLCVPVHASVSGTVIAVENRPTPSGADGLCVVIESDGRDTLSRDIHPRESIDGLSGEELVAIIREAGITVPVVAGIMPITNANQIDRALKLSGSHVPQRFKTLVDKFGSDPAAMKQAGIAYATDQIIDLFANNITNVHVYSMNKPDVAQKIQANLSDILGK